MPDSWRLIPLYEGTGVEQMAIDNWLLSQHIKGLQPACLRFYTWRSPTVSLGYHQKQFPERWNQLEHQGQHVELVRRPTGGRAVLHQGDLTYALITSGFKGPRREMYQHLCQFLIQGWRKLGVNLSFGSAGRGYIKNPNCFATATAADLVTDSGYKLIGSAQLYRAGCVLQHGSIRLNQDRALFNQVFEEETSKLDSSELDLSKLKKSNPNSTNPNSTNINTKFSNLEITEIMSALTDAACDCFNVSFEPQQLTPAMIQSAVADYLSKVERQ